MADDNDQDHPDPSEPLSGSGFLLFAAILSLLPIWGLVDRIKNRSKKYRRSK